MILPSPYTCHILVIQFLDKIESASLVFFGGGHVSVCVVYILYKYVNACIYMTAHAYV